MSSMHLHYMHVQNIGIYEYMNYQFNVANICSVFYLQSFFNFLNDILVLLMKILFVLSYLIMKIPFQRQEDSYFSFL